MLWSHYNWAAGLEIQFLSVIQIKNRLLWKNVCVCGDICCIKKSGRKHMYNISIWIKKIRDTLCKKKKKRHNRGGRRGRGHRFCYIIFLFSERHNRIHDFLGAWICFFSFLDLFFCFSFFGIKTNRFEFLLYFMFIVSVRKSWTPMVNGDMKTFNEKKRTFFYVMKKKTKDLKIEKIKRVFFLGGPCGDHMSFLIEIK